MLNRLWRKKDHRPSARKERERLACEYARHGKTRLHIGCGPRVLKDWLNIDLEYCHYKDYLKYYTDRFYPEAVRGTEEDFYAMDVTAAPFPLPDESVDLVFHEDFIEHLTEKEQIMFFAETCRVMKKGAVHRVNTPNLFVSMRDHADMRKGFAGIYFDEWDRHGHKNVLTPKILEELAFMTGYAKVIFTGRDGSAAKDVPPEYRPDPADRPEEGNIFADLIK